MGHPAFCRVAVSGKPVHPGLREVYRHWATGDWSPRFAFYADDFEWGWSPEFPDIAGVYVDNETPNTRLARWLGSWEFWACEPEGTLEFGATVVVLTRYRGIGRGSGLEVNSEGAHVWTIRGDRATRLEVFASRSAAITAARRLSAAQSRAA